MLERFQTDYNQVPHDMRGDHETMEELHMRVDDLSNALWEIVTTKKDNVVQVSCCVVLESPPPSPTHTRIHHHQEHSVNP